MSPTKKPTIERDRSKQFKHLNNQPNKRRGSANNFFLKHVTNTEQPTLESLTESPRLSSNIIFDKSTITGLIMIFFLYESPILAQNIRNEPLTP